jgi:hypothetical protein
MVNILRWSVGVAATITPVLGHNAKHNPLQGEQDMTEAPETPNAEQTKESGSLQSAVDAIVSGSRDYFSVPIQDWCTKVDNFCGIHTTSLPLIDVELRYEFHIAPETNVTGISFDSTGPAMRIKMPCGEEVVFQKFSDIPEHTVLCPCGNPKHIAWEYR